MVTWGAKGIKLPQSPQLLNYVAKVELGARTTTGEPITQIKE